MLDWFLELDAGRTFGASMAGVHPNPLAWSEIAAWSRLTGINPDPWEIAALRAMDRVRIAWEPPKPGISPDAFDRAAARRGVRIA